MDSPRFSVIVPVYNRPQELGELLESLTKQSFTDFEVIVVEDGSITRSDKVIDRYHHMLNVQYYYKPNSGPGPSRNYGYQHAKGSYLVVFDSDCIIPEQYFEIVNKALIQDQWDAWGGPDKAHAAFTPVQRAMGYTMSSLLTTGGIRGGSKRVGWFQPRSFNMGISRKVFETTDGFKFDRYAEDIEFSIRIRNAGFKIGLIAEAFVYHKRRTSLMQFYDQVKNFGKGRALIGKAHRGEVKLTHWFPVAFFLGLCSFVVLPFLSMHLFMAALIGFIIYVLLIFFHSLYVNKNIFVAFLSVPAAILQLSGYGLGFLQEWQKK